MGVANESRRCEVGEVGVRSDGILEYRYADGVEVDRAMASEMVALATELTVEPLPSLVHLGRVKGVRRDARVFFAESEENRAVTSRVALLTSSPVGTIVGNMFLGLNKPLFPTRLFTSEDKAIAWLKATTV